MIWELGMQTDFGWLTYTSLLTLWSNGFTHMSGNWLAVVWDNEVYIWGSSRDKKLTSCLKKKQKCKNSLTKYKVVNWVTKCKRILR